MGTFNEQHISELLKKYGFDRFGFTSLKKPQSFALYENWLDQGHHADMEFLVHHKKFKSDPQLYFKRAASAIVIAVPYFPCENTLPLKNLRVALYARGKDYHRWIIDQLEPLAKDLEALYKDEVFYLATDSKPVLERDLAARAGLGWIGKNTCLIDEKKGSLFFIAEILTSLVFDKPDVIKPDRCGTCTRCIDVCPTQALLPGRQLDSKKCISYLTIELKSLPPDSLKPILGDWFFGCDLCQTICPWNEKAFGQSEMQKEHFNLDQKISGVIEDLRWLLQASPHEIQQSFEQTPLYRRGLFGLLRNALLTIQYHQLEIQFQFDLKQFKEKLMHKKYQIKVQQEADLLHLTRELLMNIEKSSS